MSPILGIISSAVVPPAAGSFESIATATGTGSSATITFSSIPSDYQHLQIRYIAKSTQTGTAAIYNYSIEFNGSTSGVYSHHRIVGTGSTVSAGGAANTNIISPNFNHIPNSATALASQFAVGIIDIHDYTSTSKNKTVRIVTGSDLNRTTAPTGALGITSGLWYATPAAITSISIIVGTGSWTTTTQFALYGIKGA